MCLYEEAHGVDASHPIFQGPFPVKPTLHEMATPAHYRMVSPELGETMPAWRVHRDRCDGYVGVVADGFGFEDSPDAEWIASGRNSKNARAAALARHGQFFHWGFAATPPQMTDEARLVFLNTLAYMARFAGQKPIVVGEGRSRDWLAAYLGGRPRVVPPQIEALLRKQGGELQGEAVELSKYILEQLPEAWLAAVGQDREKLQQLCAQELGFVHRDGKRWQVDEDCKALALDNRTVALLQRCTELLGKGGADADRARRILERYTAERFATADEWQRWLAGNGEKLFHSDVVGRFERAPDDLLKPHRAAR